jgi:hypothetical protein
MATLRQKVRVVIRRPVDEVFEAYCESLYESRNDSQVQRVRVPMDARLGQGIGIWERYIDERGHCVEANYLITDFLPPVRIAFRGELFFAKKQPNKSLSAAALARTSRASWVSSFEPLGSYTRLTVEETYSYPLAWVYWITIPFRSSKRAERLRLMAYRVKDGLEQKAGLPIRRVRVRLRRSWIAWSSYLLVVALLFYAYQIRNDIGLSRATVDVLVSILSGLIAIGFVLVLLINYYFKEI